MQDFEISIRKPRTPAEWSAYYDLRYRTHHEPHGATRGSERTPQDDNQQTAHHRGVYLGNKLVAGGVLYTRPKQKTAQIGLISVEDVKEDAALRKKLLGHLEDIARNQGIGQVFLHAPESTHEQYARLGFAAAGPAPKWLDKVKQIRMEKKIALPIHCLADTAHTVPIANGHIQVGRTGIHVFFNDRTAWHVPIDLPVLVREKERKAEGQAKNAKEDNGEGKADGEKKDAQDQRRDVTVFLKDAQAFRCARPTSIKQVRKRDPLGEAEKQMLRQMVDEIQGVMNWRKVIHVDTERRGEDRGPPVGKGERRERIIQVLPKSERPRKIRKTVEKTKGKNPGKQPPASS